MITTYDLDSCEKIFQERTPDTQRSVANTASQPQFPVPMLALQPVGMETQEDRRPSSPFLPAIPLRNFFKDR